MTEEGAPTAGAPVGEADLALRLRLIQRLGETASDAGLTVSLAAGQAHWLLGGWTYDFESQALAAPEFRSRLAAEWCRTLRTGRDAGVLVVAIDRDPALASSFDVVANCRWLRRVVAALGHDLRGWGDAVGRLAADEFAVLLPETDEPGTRAVLDRMRDVLDRVEPDPAVAATRPPMGWATLSSPSVRSGIDDALDRARERLRDDRTPRATPARP